METESQALGTAAKTLNLREWHHMLLGQIPTHSELNIELALDTLPRTELKAAEAIGSKFENVLTYVPASDTWYIWDGRIHRPCEGDGIAFKVAKLYYRATADALVVVKEHYDAQAVSIKSSGVHGWEEKMKSKHAEYEKGEVAKHRRFRDNIAKNSGIVAVVNMMKTELDVGNDHFENDLQWLVLRNGVIDIADYRATRSVKLLPHDSSRPVYRYFDADFDPDTSADTWKSFLSSSVIDDGGDTVKLLQKAVGASFSAEQKPRALFNLLGAPASGKSVFLSVFNRLGQAYSVMPNNQAIQVGTNDTNYFQDLLRGARFIGFSEVQGKKSLDDGFLKGILGGDEQSTRKMRQMATPWKPQCVLFIASNMALKFDTRDKATFIKILPIPFPHSFTEVDPDHMMDRELESKLMEERSGILLWVLEGMSHFWSEGLNPTAAVLEAMDGNKTANSHALQFIDALLEAGHIKQDNMAAKSAGLSLSAAYPMFKIWAEAEGIRNVPGKQTFTTDVADFYFGKSRSDGVRFLGLIPAPHFVQNVQTGSGHLNLARNL